MSKSCFKRRDEVSVGAQSAKGAVAIIYYVVGPPDLRLYRFAG